MQNNAQKTTSNGKQTKKKTGAKKRIEVINLVFFMLFSMSNESLFIVRLFDKFLSLNLAFSLIQCFFNKHQTKFLVLIQQASSIVLETMLVHLDHFQKTRNKKYQFHNPYSEVLLIHF